MHISIPVDSNIQFIEKTEINPLISKVVIKVCYVGDNRNATHLSRETVAEMGKKLPGSPIVGKFNKETEDFEEHSREVEIKDGKLQLIDITKPYGFVPTDAKVWFQFFLDDDEITREYLCTEGYIWTKIYPESERIVSQGNNQSMELNQKSVKGNWAKKDNSNSRFFIINEAIIEKLCILGENEEPCFEGSQIKTSFALKEGFEKLRTEMYSMMQQINEEGGTNQMAEEIKKKLEEEEAALAVEEEDKDEDEKAEPVETPDGQQEEEEEEAETSPDFAMEIERLQALLETCVAENGQLKTEIENLTAELEFLRAFKQDIERKEKEDMIASFYMLSEEDKKDVIEHIDDYSLEEIEAKLSVICVRNKVSFSLDTEKEDENKQKFTFSLDFVDNHIEEIPEWIKAVQETANEMY